MSSGKDNPNSLANSAPARQDIAGTAAAGSSNPVTSPALSAMHYEASAPQAAPSNPMSSAAQQDDGPSFPPFGNLPPGSTKVPINVLLIHRQLRLAGMGSTPQITLSPTCTPEPALPGVSEDGASTQYAGSNFLSLGRASNIVADHMPMSPSQLATSDPYKSEHAPTQLRPNVLDFEASKSANESEDTQLQQSATTSYYASHNTSESVVPGNTPETAARKRKARRKKHRPKVIREQKKAKIQKPVDSTPDGKSPELKAKRSYVRKKRSVSSLEQGSKVVTDHRKVIREEKKAKMQKPVDSTPDGKSPELKVKRSYVRKKRSVSSLEQGSNVVTDHRKVIREEKKAKMQKTVNFTPDGKSPELKVKRSYVRKKRNVSSLENGSRVVTDQSISGGTEIAARRGAPVRRSLRFGLEKQGVQGDQNSTANSHQHDVEKLLVHDQSSVCSVTNSEVQVGHGPQVVMENTPAGLALGMSLRLNKLLDDYINSPEVTSEPTQEVSIATSENFAKQLAREQGNIVRSQEADGTSNNSLCFKEKVGMTVAQQIKQDRELNHFISDDFSFSGRCIPNTEPTRSETSKVLKMENHTPSKENEMFLTAKRESIIMRTAARMVAQCQTRVIKKKRSDRIPRNSFISILDLQNNSSHESTRLPQPCMDALYKISYTKPVTKKRSEKVRSQCLGSIDQNSELKNRVSSGRIVYGQCNGLEMSEENFHKPSPWILDNQSVGLNIQCNAPDGSLKSAVPYADYLQGVPVKQQHHDLNAEQMYRAEMGSSLAAPAIISFGGIYGMSNALVPYGIGGVVPYESPLQVVKRQHPRAKVDLDFETTRVWNLLMGSKTEPVDGTDVEKERWWQQEREVYQGRANSFIARMRLVQGDRSFSPWKGSVVDSVVGVFLTQNVADHLSSSAYMALASTFPPRSVNSSCTDYASVDELIQGEKCSFNYKTENASDFIQQETVMEQKVQQMSYFSSVESTASTEVLQQMQFQSEISSSQSVTLETHQARIPLSSGVPRNFLGDSPTAIYQQLGKNFDHGKPLAGNVTVTSEIECQRHKAIAIDADDVGEPETSGSSMPFCLTRKTQQLHLINEPIVSSGSASPYIKSSKDEKAAPLFIPCDSHVAERWCDKTSTATLNCPETIVDPAVDHDKNTSLEAPRIQERESHFVTVEMVAEPTTKEDECSLKSDSTSQSGVLGAEAKASRTKRTTTASKKNTENFDWDKLRRQVCGESHGKERSFERKDSVDWEAVRCADVHRVADAIRERGMNNVLAERIQYFLNRLVRDHGSIDLEWLRDIPPDSAKDFLLSIRGLGLKSVECVRLLTLHHLAFPVDTNVGRICVRLGWVPIQPLPESLQLHLLELYPILETIQKYLWPRLCKLDQQTLYELHYHMITFGKVFCTKSKPNCNACPLRSECKHFASAFASARLSLPAPQEKSLVKSSNKFDFQSSSMQPLNPSHMPRIEGNIHAGDFIPKNQDPIIEEPASPREEECPEMMENAIEDMEDLYKDDEIPTITLNMKAFAQNLEDCIKESNKGLQSDDIAKALVAINNEAASIPLPKLKNVHRLRTEHYVYELPDSHPLVQQLDLDQRELDDPSPYLLAIWSPGEIKEICDPPKPCCDPQVEGGLCNNEMCHNCIADQQNQSTYVRGTILVPCRTAMRGSFPLNGTYFQVNEVFADHNSSLNPINVKRKYIWNLQRRMVFFGTSVSSIFKGLTTEEIQQCFWRGFVCVRGFDRESRAPKPLCPRLHLVARPKKSKDGSN